MNGKNITAGLLVSMVSVALAIGITYIVAFSGSGKDRGLTFDQQKTSTNIPPLSTGTFAPVDPNFTATPTSTFNCTFPMDIWLQYPDTWRINSYRIGNRVYTKPEIINVLHRNSDATSDRLLAQVFVVVLNQQNGADATAIRSAFGDSVDWLANYPAGTRPSDGDLQKAASLVSALENFNTGLGGPLPCQYSLSEADPVVLPTLGPQDLTPQITTTNQRVYFPPTLTPRPPEPKKATRIPATATPVRTSTSAVPTPVPTDPPMTRVPPTATSVVVPPTSTTAPTNPTNTPIPNTGATVFPTPLPGGITSIAPTATRVPPTATRVAAATATRAPAATATPHNSKKTVVPPLLYQNSSILPQSQIWLSGTSLTQPLMLVGVNLF